MNHRHSLTRIAFLFGAPGGNGNQFLSGVKPDLTNVKRFLLSPNGGAWREEEIIVFNDITYAMAIMLRQNRHADFTLVYFSGHGFCDEIGNRMLCLQDTNVGAGELFQIRSKWQLNIADSCGNFLSTGIGALDVELWDYFDGNTLARQKFDQAVLASPPGFQTIFPSQPGKSTADSIGGGNFTLALLRSAKKRRTTGYSAIAIQQILNDIPKQELDNNNPIIYYKNALSLPFAVSIPPNESIGRAPAQIPPPQAKVNWGGLALLALGVFVVGSAFNSKN
jgi:hypothetical protein